MQNFSMVFKIGKSNEERMGALNFYEKAFSAQKISEFTDGGDAHIVMGINGFEILLANDFDQWCEATYKLNHPDTQFISGPIQDICAEDILSL